jgi:hypothetical protein
MPFYGTAVFDPALIIAQVCRQGSSWGRLGGLWRTDQGVGASPAALHCPQIVAVQSLFYVSLGPLLLVTLGVSPLVEQPRCAGLHGPWSGRVLCALLSPRSTSQAARQRHPSCRCSTSLTTRPSACTPSWAGAAAWTLPTRCCCLQCPHDHGGSVLLPRMVIVAHLANAVVG